MRVCIHYSIGSGAIEVQLFTPMPLLQPDIFDGFHSFFTTFLHAFVACTDHTSAIRIAVQSLRACTKSSKWYDR